VPLASIGALTVTGVGEAMGVELVPLASIGRDGGDRLGGAF